MVLPVRPCRPVLAPLEEVAPILERYWDESLRAVIQAQLREVLSQGSRQTAARGHILSLSQVT